MFFLVPDKIPDKSSHNLK